jgi:hypothetical protein
VSTNRHKNDTNRTQTGAKLSDTLTAGGGWHFFPTRVGDARVNNYVAVAWISG